MTGPEPASKPEPKSYPTTTTGNVIWSATSLEAIALDEENGSDLLDELSALGYALHVGNRMEFKERVIGTHTIMATLVGRIRCNHCRQEMPSSHAVRAPGSICPNPDCEAVLVVNQVEQFTRFLFFDGEEYANGDTLPVHRCFMVRMYDPEHDNASDD